MRAASGRLGALQRRRLGRESRFLGEGWVRGQLYNLGAYPGLVVADRTDQFVCGEIFELRAPEATLQWLDAYEGVAREGGKSNEYRRCKMSISRSDRVNLEAWVYVYQFEVKKASLIASGRWGE